MKDYKLSTKASEELEDIWHFIARDDPLAANMFIQQFLDTFKLLVVSPRMGRMRPELGEGVRAHVHGQYLILYSEKDEWCILRESFLGRGICGMCLKSDQRGEERV